MNLTVDFGKDKRVTMLIRAYFWTFELYCVLGLSEILLRYAVCRALTIKHHHNNNNKRKHNLLKEVEANLS